MASVLMFLPVEYVTLTSDGAYYALIGVNYSNNLGLVDADLSPITSRPLLSMIFGLFYRLFPPTPVTTFFILRVIYVLTPLLIYMLGTKILSKKVGFLAGIFVITSYSINNWASVIQVDYILPFFTLLYIYISYQALDKQKNGIHFLAGIIFGLALLTKETSIFFGPVPFLSWLIIREFRTKKNLIGLTFCIAAIGLMIVPWAIRVYQITNNPLGFLGKSAQEASNLLIQETTQTKLLSYISSFGNYYKNQLAQNFVLAPLMLISVFVAIINIFVSKKQNQGSYIFLGIVILLSTPIIIFQGNVGFRPQQSITLFLVLFILLADLFVQIYDWIISKSRYLKILPEWFRTDLLGLIIFLAPIIIQAGWDKTGNILQYTNNYNTVKTIAQSKIGGWKVEYYDKQIISDWIMDNIPTGTRFMGYIHNTRPISFLTLGNYQFYNFPFIYSSQLSEIENTLQQKHPILVDLDQYGNQFERDLIRSNLVVLNQEDILTSIQKNNIDYIFVGGYFRWLAIYFENHPDFIKVADFGVGETQIFKVINRPSIINAPLAVGDGVPQFLKVIKQTNYERYKQYINNFFKAKIGMDKNQVEQIIYEESPTIKFDTYINGKSFAELSSLFYGVDNAIAIQEEKLKFGDYWPSLLLGHLYVVRGEPEIGMEWFKKYILSSESSDALKNIKIGVQDRFIKLYVMRYEDLPPIYPRTEDFTQIQTISVLNFIDELAYSKEINFSDTANINKAVFIIDGEPRRVLFQHPSSSLTFKVNVPPGAQLQFSPALAPEIWWQDLQDGVEFNVYLRDEFRIERLFSKLISPNIKSAQQHWINAKIDLSRWANTTVEIIFETTPGVNGNSAFDWGGWGEPRLTVPLQYEFLNALRESEFFPADSKYIRTDQMEVGYENRSIIFAHPDSKITYDLTLPENPSLLFGIGMDTTVWDPQKGDGVEYLIDAALPEEPGRVYRVYSRYIDPKNNPGDRHWFDERVDLSAFAGKQVRLTFQTRPGPAGNYDFDWAGWSRPVLVDGLGAVLPAVVSQD